MSDCARQCVCVCVHFDFAVLCFPPPVVCAVVLIVVIVVVIAFGRSSFCIIFYL